MNSNRSHTTLIVVDIQWDFLPGEALGVADGDGVIEPIAKLISSDDYRIVVATQDWHPPGHISFASSHAGRQPFDTIALYGTLQTLWPDHCVAGSRGAEMHPALPWERARAIIRKGCDPIVDSYSAFRNNPDQHGARPPTGLGGYLRECGITDILVCGLARDYCVRYTAEDGVDLGFSVAVNWQLTRPVNSGQDNVVLDALVARGVEIVNR